MGHSLHTYFSNQAQPYAKADYRIFVAEVASTVNEVLLLKYIYSESKDKNLKKYLLNYYLDTIRTTLHRQTMFAEFESEAHAKVEKGEPLTSENLCEIYLALNKKYYGDSIVAEQIRDVLSGGSAHAAVNIPALKPEKLEPVKDYMKFLSSGGSDSPAELLKIAGVDLTKKDAFSAAMLEFEDTLAQFEKLCE